MMQRFPGRTLEELDGMDYGRFLRAVEAERMEGLERKRRLYLDDKLKAKDMTEAEWAAFAEHDRMVGDDG